MKTKPGVETPCLAITLHKELLAYLLAGREPEHEPRLRVRGDVHDRIILFAADQGSRVRHYPHSVQVRFNAGTLGFTSRDILSPVQSYDFTKLFLPEMGNAPAISISPVLPLLNPVIQSPEPIKVTPLPPERVRDIVAKHMGEITEEAAPEKHQEILPDNGAQILSDVRAALGLLNDALARTHGNIIVRIVNNKVRAYRIIRMEQL